MNPNLRYVAGLILACTAVTLQPAAADGEHLPSRATADANMSITLFGGFMTDNRWTDFFTPETIDFGDSVLVGIATSHRLWRFGDRAALEIEGQLVRHFGKQDHWELNLPVVGRWRAFPWDSWLDTSIALGIGPSFANKLPKVEVAQAGSSEQWLVYWLAEIEAGFLSSPWRGLIRIHHRSGAYGVVADKGGSNVLTIGIRRYW